jgi:partner of Y14 and mago protein
LLKLSSLNSIRKERRVKPGFTPAEDVRRFRPSRVLEAQERKGNVPGYEPAPIEAARKAMSRTTISSPASPSRADGDWRRAPALSVKDNKGTTSNTNRGSTSSNGGSSSTSWRKKEVAAEKIPDDWEEEDSKKEDSSVAAEAAPSGNTTINRDDEEDAPPPAVPVDDGPSEGESDKKARALKKKVRAAQALQDRHKQDGDPLLPEQQAKVDLLDDMIREP